MTRFARIRDRLPSLYRPEDDATDLLSRILKAIGGALDRLDGEATEVMQSHWLDFADRALYSPYVRRSREIQGRELPRPGDTELLLFPFIDDLARLGSLLALLPWRDPLASREVVEAYRRRIRRIVALYRDGLGTNLRGAFQTLSVEYDRPDSLSLRNYVDAYYVLNPSLISGRFTPTFQQSWRDYRATVTAIAKTDADPRTPDPSLGVCSIQVTFRDWIGPWVTLDYMANLEVLADRYRGRLGPRVREDFAGSIGRVRKEVTDILDGKGLLGRQRDYRAINVAVDRIGNGVPFRDDLVRSVTNAVNVQQTVEFAQVAAIGVEDPTAAFSFLSDTATRADTQVAAAQGRIEERVQDQVAQQQQSFRDELFRADGTLMVLQSRVNAVESSVGGFEEALSQKINLREFERLIPNII